MNSLVRKRDGRLEPFQESKLEATILKGFGALASDQEQKNLAEDLTRSLTFFLFRGRESETSWRGRAGSVVTSEEVKVAVLRALRETGHLSAADNIAKHSAWRSDRQKKVLLPANETLQVLNSGGESPWTKSRVHSKLVAIGIEPKLAADIARQVEERIFSSGLQRISGTLLREMIDAELSQRGFNAQIGPRDELSWTSQDIDGLLDAGQGQDPQSFALSIAGHTLQQYSLEQVFRGNVGLAMEHGAIALQGSQGCLSCLSIDLSSATESTLELTQQTRSLERFAHSYLNWTPSDTMIEKRELGEWVSAISPKEPKLVTRLNPKQALATLNKGWRTPLHIDITPKSLSSEEAQQLFKQLQSGAEEGAISVTLSHTGGPPYPWSHHGERTVVTDLCFINLARVALRAGRGERARFSNILEVSIRLAVQALLLKRNLLEGKVLRPDLPLWQPERGSQATMIPELPPASDFWHGLVPVGLTSALSYLIGEPLGESTRGERLAEDVFREFRRLVRAEGKRQKLRVAVYDSFGDGADAIRRAFSQADLMGFPDAGELDFSAGHYELGIPKVEGSLKRKLTRALGLARSLDSEDLKGLEERAWIRWLKAGTCLTTESRACSRNAT